MENYERFVAAVGRPATAVPLDEAVLCIAAQASPGLDVDAQLARLDELAASCPQASFGSVISHLFGEGGFAGDTERYDDPANSFLDKVLDRRRGLPIALSVVAIEVGRRAEVPIVGIGMPGHFLVRDAIDDRSYADPFHGDARLDAEACRRLFHAVVPGGAWEPAYLRPVDALAIVGRMLNNLQAAYLRRGDLAGLQWVLRLRAGLPGASPQQRVEAMRLLAGLN
jgi:regulator of sirC expression with transglutaminase-like and TPR domain